MQIMKNVWAVFKKLKSGLDRKLFEFGLVSMIKLLIKLILHYTQI